MNTAYARRRNDEANLFIDEEKMWAHKFQTSDGRKSVCGNGNHDELVHIRDILLDHTATTVTIVVNTTIFKGTPLSYESFGIDNLRIMPSKTGVDTPGYFDGFENGVDEWKSNVVSSSEVQNVALHAGVKVTRGKVYRSGSESTLTNGMWLAEGSRYTSKNSSYAHDCNVVYEIDLNGTQQVSGLMLQAEGNDRVKVQYRNSSSRAWYTMWTAAPVAGSGMRVRPAVGKWHMLSSPVGVDAVQLTYVKSSSRDRCYWAVSQLQLRGAYGELSTTSCGRGAHAHVLGGYGVSGGGKWMEKSYDLSTMPHDELHVSLDFLKLDGWDDESAVVLVDGKEVWAQAFGHNDGVKICGNGNPDVRVRVDKTVLHSSDTVTVRVRTSLNENAHDESFAIDNVRVQPLLVGYFDRFRTGQDGWMTNSTSGVNMLARTSKCGGFGDVLGGYGVAGRRQYLQKTYDLASMKHDILRITMDVIKIDRWEHESLDVYADGVLKYSHRFADASAGKQQCGQGYHDVSESVDFHVDHTADSVTILVNTTLDERSTDESFAIDNVRVLPITTGVDVPGYFDGFEDGMDEWKSNNSALTTSECESQGMVLGGFSNLGAHQYVNKTYDLAAYPHDKLRLSFDFLKAGAWERETATLFADGKEVWSREFSGETNGACGTTTRYDSLIGYRNMLVHVDTTLDHDTDSVTLVMNTTLNEATTNEAFGLDNVHVLPLLEGTWDKFTLSSDGWTLGDGKAVKRSRCGAYGMILGGYGVASKGAVLQKTYDLSAMPHDELQVEMSFFKIDAWERGESATVMVDGRIVWAHAYGSGSVGGKQMCGRGDHDVLEHIDVTVDHTSDYVVLRVKTTLDQSASDESFGIDDVRVITSKTGVDRMGYFDAFEHGADEWSSNVTKTTAATTAASNLTTKCGNFTSLLGGYGVTGGGTYVEKVFDLTTMAHDELLVSLDFVKLDYWTGENGRVLVDGKVVWERSFDHGGGINMCGSPQYPDERTKVVETLLHSSNTVTIRVDTTLKNADARRAAFAVDNVRIEPRLVGYFDTFSTGPGHEPWLDAQGKTMRTSMCGAFGQILGGYNIAGKGASVNKTYGLGAMPHDMLRLSLDFIKIDNWRGEEAQVLVDGVVVWSHKFYSGTDGGAQQCGGRAYGWNEIVEHIDVRVEHTAASATINVTTSIGRTPNYESFGIDNVRLIPIRTGVDVAGYIDTFEDGVDEWSSTDTKGVEPVTDTRTAVVADTPWDANFNAKHVLLYYNDERDDHIWLGKRHTKGAGFTLDLGEPRNVTAFKLRNTHGGNRNNFGTNAFHISLSPTLNGTFTPALNATFTDPRTKPVSKYPAAWVELRLPAGKAVNARYVRFVEDTYYGPNGGGLNSFMVLAEGRAVTTSTCGSLGTILGGYNVLGRGQYVEKAFDLATFPHDVLEVWLTFIKVDSWESDKEARMLVDGVVAWTHSFTPSEGKQICGNGGHEVVEHVHVKQDHTADLVTIRVDTTLNEPVTNEAYAVDNVRVQTSLVGYWDKFASSNDDWSTAGDAPAGWSTCGAFGAILGGYNVAGKHANLMKTFDLATMPHDQLRVSMDFIKIDTW